VIRSVGGDQLGADVPSRVLERIGPVASCEPLRGGALNPVTGGIWRVRGAVGSAILKILTAPSADRDRGWESSDAPAHWNYWRREAEALSSGLAATAYAEAGLAGPELLTAVVHPRAIELWCAEATGVPGTEQRGPDMVRLAERLGAGQAAWVDAVPGEPWLSRRWLRQYVESKPVAPARKDWDHPLVAAVWPESLRKRLRLLWKHRHQLVERVESLPRTLAHLDVWPANVVGDTLLDWAFVGDGAVGEDVGNLVPDAFFDGFLPLEDLPDLALEAPRAYARTVAAESGGRVDEATALLGVRAGGAAKYGWLAPLMLSRLGEQRWASYGGGPQREPADVLAARRPVLELVVNWADIALGR
jgi:hypothetical protein